MIRTITPRSILGLLGLAAMLCVASPAEAQYELVSVSSAGVLSNGYSLLASTSADGRFVVFGSTATNLTTEQTSGLFLRNRVSRKTTKLVAPGFVRAATVSDDGRYVVWDNGGTAYRKDMDTGAVSTLQHPPSDSQHEPVVFGAMQMGDGRHVAYFGDARVRQSTVYYLLDGIFVRDMQTGEVCAAHTASDGTPGNQPINVATDETVPPSVSADGRFVVFFSIATNLLGTNGGLKETAVRFFMTAAPEKRGSSVRYRIM